MIDLKKYRFCTKPNESGGFFSIQCLNIYGDSAVINDEDKVAIHTTQNRFTTFFLEM